MFYPTRHFDSVFDITVDTLKSEGVRAVVLDIDNTLVPYKTEVPDEKVKNWIGSLRSAGIAVTIASNNNAARVEKFCSGLDVTYSAKSGKPLTKCIKVAMKESGAAKKEICVIGDQIFTDILCAGFGGTKSFLLTPIDQNENKFIKFKRMLEKPIISSYRKRHPEQFTEVKK